MLIPEAFDTHPHPAMAQRQSEALLKMAGQIARVGDWAIDFTDETDAQYSFLAEHHCQAYRGNLFNKPQPASIFENWVATQACGYAAAPQASKIGCL